MRCFRFAVVAVLLLCVSVAGAQSTSYEGRGAVIGGPKVFWDIADGDAFAVSMISGSLSQNDSSALVLNPSSAIQANVWLVVYHTSSDAGEHLVQLYESCTGAGGSTALFRNLNRVGGAACSMTGTTGSSLAVAGDLLEQSYQGGAGSVGDMASRGSPWIAWQLDKTKSYAIKVTNKNSSAAVISIWALIVEEE